MKRIRTSLVILGFGLSLFTVSCKKEDVSVYKKGKEAHVPDMLSNRVILDWNYIDFLAQGGAAMQHALLAVRSDAMVHIAMHDAINAINPLYETYAFHQQGSGS